MQKKWLKTTFFAIESQYEAFATQVPEIQPGPSLNFYPLSLDVPDICFEYNRLYYFGFVFFGSFWSLECVFTYLFRQCWGTQGSDHTRNHSTTEAHTTLYLFGTESTLMNNGVKEPILRQNWWPTPVISALKRLKQEDQQCKADSETVSKSLPPRTFKKYILQ